MQFFGFLMFAFSGCSFALWMSVPYPNLTLGFVWLLPFWIGVAAYSIGAEQKEAMTKLEQFISDRKLRMKISSVAENPGLAASQADFDGHLKHWECVLKYGRQTMHTYISTIDVPTPSLEQVLLCLAEQAREFDPDEEYTWWASRVNLEPKEERTRKIHEHLSHEVKRLETFLGTDGYKLLLRAL